MSHRTTIQLFRGVASAMPSLADGEPGWTTDSHVLYVGSDGVNVQVGGGGAAGAQTPTEDLAVTQLAARVGPITGTDGTTLQQRAGKTGDCIVQQGRGKYYEATSRGNCFAAQTGAAGVAHGTTWPTTTSPFCLYNPKGSGKRLVIQKIGMVYQSGTLGVGNVLIGVMDPAKAGEAIPTGTALTPVNLQAGNGAAAVAKAFTTATIANAPVGVGLLCSLAAMDGTGTYLPALAEKDVDGEIVIEPGAHMDLQGNASSGSTPKVQFNVTWEEVPIV